MTPLQTAQAEVNLALVSDSSAIVRASLLIIHNQLQLIEAQHARAIRKYAEGLKAYDDECPDVGMPWHFSHFEERAKEELGL